LPSSTNPPNFDPRLEPRLSSLFTDPPFEDFPLDCLNGLPEVWLDDEASGDTSEPFGETPAPAGERDDGGVGGIGFDT